MERTLEGGAKRKAGEIKGGAMPARTHGCSKNGCRLYRIWSSMKTRCFNPKRGRGRYYAKGVIVCDNWKNSFEAFMRWALANGYKDDLTIDRIDNDGNYEPSNCRWVTPRQQARNTSANVWITYNGETMLQTDWANRIGLSVGALRRRIAKYGVEKALSMPRREWEKIEGPNGVCDTLSGWAKRLCLNKNTLRERVDRHGVFKALRMPRGDCPPKLMECNGVTDSIGGWSRRLGISVPALKWRVRRYGIQRALTMEKTGVRTEAILVCAGKGDSVSGWAKRLGCSTCKIKWRIREFGKENAISVLLSEIEGESMSVL